MGDKFCTTFSIIIYSETSLNQPALGPKNIAGLEGCPVL
jgi:hypothetical protein